MEQPGQQELAEQYSKRQRELNAKVIDRVASDAGFAQALKEDPERAFREAGLEAEVRQIAAMVPQAGPDEVRGQGWYDGPGTLTMFRSCYFWTSVWVCV